MNIRSALAFSPGAAGPALDDDDPLAWQRLALCAETDPEAFFPEQGGSAREAKRVCRPCRARGQCLRYALDNDERFGIWGGMSERERRRVKRAGVITGDVLTAAARDQEAREDEGRRRQAAALAAVNERRALAAARAGEAA